ncbi:MAG TPA: 2-hydroxychromene-2-carboxylate isomerase [Ideonella sp.]|uniref:2-hydroxychromene-2-carboxylate isomerase n=1 Tax=Ideonella sp. TaxID=1929293 RepID=UPI002C16BBF2|nr:2-hydroxychromene-2-carboxylate isomerase [Ideonella sp.]HSI51534.1 2-hydroxychromene-2-carboxylate isomerase [Ideonella sp.]
MPAAIDFFFDFSSPYAYIANEWIDALAARHGRPVRRHAILLGVAFQAAELKSPVSHPVKREYTLLDFERSARFERVPYRQPSPFPIATQNAARVFWWLHDTQGPDAAAAWSRAGMRAYFTRGVPLNEPVALKALVAETALDAEAAQDAWGDPVWKQRLKQANDDALALGVFGAPFFIIDGEPFWGNDRKPQLERRLADGRI